MVRQDHAGLAFVTPVPQEVTLRHFELWRESVAEDRPVVELELQQPNRSRPSPFNPKTSSRSPGSGSATSVSDGFTSRAHSTHDTTSDHSCASGTDATGNAVDDEHSRCLDDDGTDDAAIYTLTVIGRERKGVLAEITEFLTSVGLETLSARIFTLPNHSIMDMFTLRDPHNILADDGVTSSVYSALFHIIGVSDPAVVSGDRPEDRGAASAKAAKDAVVAAAAAISGNDFRTPQQGKSDQRAASVGTAQEGSRNTRADASASGSQPDKDAILAMACMKPVGSNLIPRNLRRSHSNVAVTDLDNEMRSQQKQWKNPLDQNGLTPRSSDVNGDTQGRSPDGRSSQPEVDLAPLHQGDWLLFYSSNSRQRYRYHFRLSEDSKFLLWEGNSLKLSSCVGVLFGIKSKTFQDLHDKNDLIDPPWLCFSLVTFPTADKYTEPSTVDLACESEDQLPTWLFGLQSLCSTTDPNRNDLLTYESLLVQRAKYKIATRAHDRGLTVYQYVLKKVRKYAQHIDRESEMNMRDEELAQLEAKLVRLKQALRIANARETMLATQLRTVQADWDIKYNELTFDHCIGHGAYSEMWKGIWRSCAVAVKVLKAPEGTRPLGSGLSNSESNDNANAENLEASDKRFLHDFLEEVVVLSKLRHPNILLFMAACAHPPNLCIVTEFCHGGNLYNALRRRNWRENLGFDNFVSMAKDAARGMHYLHCARIIHRDFKSQNLLLDRPVENGCPVLKVADFGLSRKFHGIGVVDTSSNDRSVAGVMTSETGTYRWMAPEMIRHEPYNEKVDVYSYAVTLWEFYTCEVPFAGLSPIQAAFAVADKDLRPSAVSSYGKANPIPRSWAVLLEKCWSPSPHERPRFVEILRVLDEMEIYGPDVVPPFWASWRTRRGENGGSGFSTRSQVASHPVGGTTETCTASFAAQSAQASTDKSPPVATVVSRPTTATQRIATGPTTGSLGFVVTGMGHSGSAPNLGKLDVSN